MSRVRYCWSSVVSRVPSQDSLAKSVPWVSWASECGESGPSSSTNGAIVDKREDKRRRVASSVATSSGSRVSQVTSEAMTYLKTAHERCSQALVPFVFHSLVWSSLLFVVVLSDSGAGVVYHDACCVTSQQ